MYHYLEYLPLYLREMEEFKALGISSDPPAREAYEYTIQQYRNQFILQASDQVLSRWEKIFRLSNPGLDIAFRRQRILSKFCFRSPITSKRLEELIRSITGAQCEITVDFLRYHMQVQVFEHDYSLIHYPFLFAEIDELKPANLTLALHVVAMTEVTVPIGAAAAPSLMRGCELTPLVPVLSEELVVRLTSKAESYQNKLIELEVIP